LPVGALTDVTVALEWTARVPSVSSEECASSKELRAAACANR
jgi:hypothetical protein